MIEIDQGDADLKILVTGGAGFIGSHIVDALIEAGHHVAVVDDLSSGNLRNINARAAFHQADIRDLAALRSIFAEEKPEIVCHQAAKMSVQESLREPVLYAQVNILGSLNLLQLCRDFGVTKFLYASTGGAVYGEPEYLPVDEKHPINPLDPYGASKHHVEHYLFLYQHNFGLHYTVLRYPNVYGPRQNAIGEGGVIAIFSSRMIRGQPVIINGSGEQERDFLYVGDVARANLMACDRANNTIVNLGTGKGTSVNAIFRQLNALTGSKVPEIHGDPKPGEVFKTWLNAEKARSELGWTPAVSLEDGLRATVEYFKQERELAVG